MRRGLEFRTAGGPLGRVLAAIAAVVLFASAVVMGALLAALLLGLALVGSLAFLGRIWWLRRRQRAAPAHFETHPAAERPAIDAEFHVVERESPPPRPRAGDD
jgi:uncharacterized iron-regulated membrane protein